MPQLVKKRRSGWAVLAAGALIASLLAVGASPAGAQAGANDKADNATVLSACVGAALDDHMFTDVSDGHAFGDAINCVAYYGITNGTGDGATYSPNQDVTRAEMAVFIARAAGVAGVDVGSGSGGFSDIGGVWQEAQDAINALGAKGMIPSGGEFRPDDAITRAEMATFLVGLMVEAAPNIWKDTQGVLRLSGRTTAANWDWFQDARDAMPAENDGEISALFELGVTKGASAASVQNKYRPPLDYNYEPFGTVDRGQMAEFITRALAHTSARPEGVTAQHDWITGNVVVSMRDAEFQPIAGETVDVIRIPTSSEDAAFKGNGECSIDVDNVGTGKYGCEIEGADPITGGDGDARVHFDSPDDGGTTVWAWTGEGGDKLDDDTVLYRFEATKDTPRAGVQVRIKADHPGIKKVHLGSSVLYTLQLEDKFGADTTIGPDDTDPRPSRFLVTTSIYAVIPNTTAFDMTEPVGPTNNRYRRNVQGSYVQNTFPLTTDDDGKATFSVSALPDLNPSVDRDEYVVEVHIQGQQGDSGNTRGMAYYLGTDDEPTPASQTTRLVPVREAATELADYWDALVFSTEPNAPGRLRVVDGDATVVPGVSVSVTPAARYIASNSRGASTRATVTAVDQYNDPISGADVSLMTDARSDPPDTEDLDDDPNTAPTERSIPIANDRAIATGRDGSYTFGYTRENGASDDAVLTGSWDHDDDGCADSTTTCVDTDGDDSPDATGTGPVEGTATVRWAATARAAQGTGQQIRSFDKDANTIYAGADDAVTVFYYDENDRYNVIIGGVATSPADSSSVTTYAGFERRLSTFTGFLVRWETYSLQGRAVNEFTLITPA